MGKPTNKSRRRLLKTVAAGAASWPALKVLGQNPAPAAHQHAATQKAASRGAAYKPAFFNAHEYATVGAVAERIIPTDETPGSREAQVAEFIDRMVNAQPDLHEVYRGGIAWLDAQEKTPFVKLAAKRQDEILRALSDSKENDAPARFFKSVRGLTIDGFYTSKVGLKELGYTGNSYLLEFKGCTHPEHG